MNRDSEIVGCIGAMLIVVLIAMTGMHIVNTIHISKEIEELKHVIEAGK